MEGSNDGGSRSSLWCEGQQHDYQETPFGCWQIPDIKIQVGNAGLDPLYEGMESDSKSKRA